MTTFQLNQAQQEEVRVAQGEQRVPDELERTRPDLVRVLYQP